MKKFGIVVITVVFCLWAQGAFAEDLKIGYISLKEVLDDYKRVTDGEDQLLKEAEKKNVEREEMVKTIKSMREKIDLLDDSEKEKKQQELDEKIKELQDFTYQTRSSLRQDRDEKLREIMDEIKEVLSEYGKSNSYSFIIDDTLLLYKKDNADVTEDVTKMLNQRYKQ